MTRPPLGEGPLPQTLNHAQASMHHLTAERARLGAGGGPILTPRFIPDLLTYSAPQSFRVMVLDERHYSFAVYG